MLEVGATRMKNAGAVMGKILVNSESPSQPIPECQRLTGRHGLLLLQSLSHAVQLQGFQLSHGVLYQHRYFLSWVKLQKWCFFDVTGLNFCALQSVEIA